MNLTRTLAEVRERSRDYASGKLRSYGGWDGDIKFLLTEIDRLQRELNEARTMKEDQGRALELADVIALAKAENYGSTLRVFIKKISRGYHLKGSGHRG